MKFRIVQDCKYGGPISGLDSHAGHAGSVSLKGQYHIKGQDGPVGWSERDFNERKKSHEDDEGHVDHEGGLKWQDHPALWHKIFSNNLPLPFALEISSKNYIDNFGLGLELMMAGI